MDEDHRCLAAILRHIAPDLRCCADGGWNWAIDVRLLSRLEALGAHTREHFRREEQAMRDSDYPAFAQHKAEQALDRAYPRVAPPGPSELHCDPVGSCRCNQWRPRRRAHPDRRA